MEAKALSVSPEDISTFYIQATESIQERWPRTLKQGDTFALFDALGDCVAPGLTPGGVFHNDTRHLSGIQLLIDGQRPLLLSSSVENDNVVFTAHMTNHPLPELASLGLDDVEMIDVARARARRRQGQVEVAEQVGVGPGVRLATSVPLVEVAQLDPQRGFAMALLSALCRNPMTPAR